MRTILSILCGLCLTITVYADHSFTNAPLTFEITDGDVKFQDIAFDSEEVTPEQAQSTCVMTPGLGNRMLPLLELAPVIEPEIVTLAAYTDSQLAPMSALNLPQPNPRNYGQIPPPIVTTSVVPDNLTEPALTPEPATLGIMLVGLLGLAFYTRRKERYH